MEFKKQKIKLHDKKNRIPQKAVSGNKHYSLI
jgi:hypothetical protein